MDKNLLSECESNIMHCLWKTGKDISIPDLTEMLKDYGKEYARTTVVTFLIRLSAKGFVSTYRKGRISYAHVEKPKEEYMIYYMGNIIDTWFNGSVSKCIEELCKRNVVSKEDLKKIIESVEE